MKKLKSLVFTAAIVALPAVPAHAIGKPDLKSCEAANVRLHDLAIGANGKGVRSFYKGEVLVLQIDQVEPAAASSGLVVLMFDHKSEIGGRVCTAVTHFNSLDIDAAKSAYDPESGVTLTVPARDYDGIGSRPGKPLVLTINAAKGEVTATR